MLKKIFRQGADSKAKRPSEDLGRRSSAAVGAAITGQEQRLSSNFYKFTSI